MGSFKGKLVLILSTLGVTGLSILISIFFSRPVALISGILFTVGLLIIQNITVHREFKSALDLKITQVQTNVLNAIQMVATELSTVKGEIATKTGLPFVSKYLELHDGSCPLFKYAAGRVYQKAVHDLNALANQQILITDEADVYDWLQFLFKLPEIQRIKATSYGEFKEWKAVETWASRDYFELHRMAHQRGATVERIFIVRNEHQAKGGDAVFIFNHHCKYHVLVKVVLEGRIRAADLHARNCLVFCNERDEPLYALIAQHNREGFQSAVIFGAPAEVEKVTTMYSHIDEEAEPYVDGESKKLAPPKTA
jgi:hypothetical protein